MNWNSKEVLVTGGAGFLGLNLVRKLWSFGCELTILENFSTGIRKELGDLPIRLIEANVADRASLDRIDDIDYIFHLGSPSSVILFNKDPKTCFRETTEGWMNVLEFGRRISVKKIVFPSSGSLYGRVGPPHSETREPRPSNLYAVSKLACENIVEAFENPPPTTILRIFAGYGPGENHKGEFASPVTLFFDAITRNERPVIYGDGNQTRDFVYVDDVVNAILKSAETDFQGIVNVGSGATHSFNEVVNIINSELNKKAVPHYIPEPPHYLAKTLADVTRMKEVLGIEPISLEQGVNKYHSALLGD